MEATLQFKGYIVEQMNYYLKENSRNIESIDESISPEFLFKIALCPENIRKINVLVGVRIGEESQLPFMVDVLVRGAFEVREGIDEVSEIIDFCSLNGSAILFPYVRTIISNLTSMGNKTAIILPTMNFYEVIKRCEDIRIDDSMYKEI